MVERPKGPIAPWMAERLKMPPGSLLGARDVAALLGVTRQRVSQLKKEPTFPKSGVGYGSVRLWHKAGIQCWAAAHRQAKPDAAGRFAGAGGTLLSAAEHHARRMDIHWVDSGMFWLAVAVGEAGEPLRHALESMGITAGEIESGIDAMRPSDERPSRALRMNPLMQTFLTGADRAVERDGRDLVEAVDILLACIDAKPIDLPRRRSQPADHLLAAMAFRGLDITELRRRLVVAHEDPERVGSFEPRGLGPRRRRRIAKPRFELAPNPLGHDPRMRHPWGAAFARTREGRHLEVDGDLWFFTTDGDGFYVRAADGRPVGYRYRKLTKAPKRTPEPVNGFMEVLPMPPVEMADWPDKRFGPPE